MVKNAKHDIIDIAKPRSLRLLHMVEPTGLVESDIGVATVELDGGVDGLTSGGLIESEQVVGHADPVGFHWMTLAVVVVADARLVEVALAPLLRVGSQWEQCATHAFFHHRKPKLLALLSFLQVEDITNNGKLPPMISRKMNTDSFGSKMESESDLEEHGFGGVGITDEVLAFARNIGMHPETWLDFSIDEEEDLDHMCVFFFFFIQISNQKVNA